MKPLTTTRLPAKPGRRAFSRVTMALPASMETGEGAQTFRLQITGFGFHVGHHVGQMVKLLADMKILKKPGIHGFSCSIESSWPT